MQITHSSWPWPVTAGIAKTVSLVDSGRISDVSQKRQRAKGVNSTTDRSPRHHGSSYCGAQYSSQASSACRYLTPLISSSLGLRAAHGSGRDSEPHRGDHTGLHLALGGGVLGGEARGRGLGGVTVSILGVVLISLGEGFGVEPGALLVLLAALSTSAYFVLQKPYLSRYGSFGFTAYAVWAGTLFLLPFACGLLEEARRAALGPTLAAAYLGVFATIAAYAS